MSYLEIKLGAKLMLSIVETDDKWIARALNGQEVLDILGYTRAGDGFSGPEITLLAAVAESRWPEFAGWPPTEAQARGALQARAATTPHSYQRDRSEPGVWTCKTCGNDRDHPAHV